MFCPPVRGDNPRTLAGGLSPEKANKLLYNNFTTPLSVNTLLIAKSGDLWQGGRSKVAHTSWHFLVQGHRVYMYDKHLS